MSYIIREVTTTRHNTMTRYYGPFIFEKTALDVADEREFHGITGTIECYVEELRPA